MVFLKSKGLNFPHVTLSFEILSQVDFLNDVPTNCVAFFVSRLFSRFEKQYGASTGVDIPFRYCLRTSMNLPSNFHYPLIWKLLENILLWIQIDISRSTLTRGGVAWVYPFFEEKNLIFDFWATIWSQRPQNTSPDSLDVSLQDSKKNFMFPPFFEIFWAMMPRSSM